MTPADTQQTLQLAFNLAPVGMCVSRDRIVEIWTACRKRFGSAGPLLFDQDQVVLSAFGTRPASPVVAVRGALAGHQVSSPATLWPWVREPLMVAVPPKASMIARWLAGSSSC